MLDQIVIDIFYAVIASSLIFGVINTLRSNFYDIRMTRLRRERRQHPFARHLRQRPTVNVIIHAHNDASVIAACLSSLVTGSYKKLNLIVVDNASADNTPSLVRKFAKDRPNLQLRLVAKRRRDSRQQAIAGAAKYIKTGLVLVIDAGVAIRPDAIKDAVLLHLQTQTPVIEFNSQIDHGYKLLGLSSKLRGIATIRSKKSGGFIVPGFDSYNYASLYSDDIFTCLTKHGDAFDDINALHQACANSLYDSQAIVTVGRPALTASNHTSSRHIIVNLISYLRAALSLVEPLLAVFMLYVAVMFNNPAYFTLGWLTFTLLLMLAIWSDETRGALDKLQLSILALVSYVLYVLQSLLGLIRLLYNSGYASVRRQV